MACYHPNKGYIVGVRENGKKIIKFKSYRADYIWSSDGDVWYDGVGEYTDIERSRLKRVNEYLWYDPYTMRKFCFEYVTLPCGQCIGCRIDKSKEWANRMLCEATYHDESYFITLTYNDASVPRSEYFDTETGEMHTSLTLRKKDFQNFMKRLRKATSVPDPVTGKVLDYSKVRFYAAGEYGSTTYRPHYHSIIFNLHLDDLVFYKRQDGFNYYTSEFLNALWPYGFVVVAPITWETCAYVARYTTKKICGTDADFYETFNIEPEFSLMSRKPGIGRKYFEDHKYEIYEDYKIRFELPNGGRSFKPPRYYDNLFDVDNHARLQEIKEVQIQTAERIKQLKLSKTNLSYLELLALEEDAFKHRTSSLVRSDC